MLVALISEYQGAFIIADIIEVQSEKSLVDIRNNFNYPYVIAVNETVQISKNEPQYIEFKWKG